LNESEIDGLSIQPQIPFEELLIEKEIGRGHYGKVCLGKWKGHYVALKFCKEKGSLEEFLREANVMM
jgi:predicted Ser/Thr protein kinase